ncbi:MAG: DUF11 domain-containing protein [Saprospirales bacterium]|nr:DUF11 domain-containing protein [Saprospirales bacterium]
MLSRMLLLWCCFATGALSAQSFRRAYAPESSFCRDVVETADGGFLLVGGIESDNRLFIQRTGPDGAVLWSRHQALNGACGIAVCQAPDGGFAILCENYLDNGVLRNLVLRTDAAGVSQWQKILDNPSLANGFRDIVAVSGGGFVAAGDARSLMPAPDFHIDLVKLDNNGNLQWRQSVGDPNDGKELGFRLAELPNGDLLVAGERREAASTLHTSDFFLARTDAQGNTLWQKEYPKTGYQTLADFKTDQYGNCYLAGETKQTDPAWLTVLKTDANGAELWYKQPLQTFTSTSGFTLVNCLSLDLAGNAYIPVYQFDQSAASLSLLKLNTAGDTDWLRGSDAQDLPFAALYTSDNQFALAGHTSVDAFPQKAVLIKSDWSGALNTFYSTLSGVVFWDQDGDCAYDFSEPPPPKILVAATDLSGNTLYQAVSPTGQYSFSVEPGVYNLVARPVPGTATLWQVCDTPTVGVAAIGLSLQAPPIGLQSVVDCPYLALELGAGPLRRCTTANYVVEYCNYGTQTAAGAALKIAIDPLQSYVSSTIPLAAQQGDTLEFALGDLPPGHCNAFQLKLLLSCAAQTNQTVCTEAHIFPDSSCLPPDPDWDGSNLVVSAECNGVAQFGIRNTGANMTGPVSYVIIEDQILYMQGNVRLDAGADTVIQVPNPAGASYYVQAAQRPGHPAAGPSVAVANMCNGQNGPSLALQLPPGSADPFLDTYCNLVVGAFDPNDKRGFPLGWRDEHYLESGQEIEYMIRFQNTGNDTAFLVVVRDTLPAELDPASVQPGVASHPYAFRRSGSQELAFTFSRILLPDSTTNEPESHGFLTFRVSPRPDLPLGTRLENRAAIYFDFNDPVITNTYFHTIGQPLLTFAVDPPAPGGPALSVFPNPATNGADFRLDPPGAYRFRLFDAAGRLLREERFEGDAFRFERRGLKAGFYFFRLEDARGKTTGGKLLLQ